MADANAAGNIYLGPIVEANLVEVLGKHITAADQVQ